MTTRTSSFIKSDSQYHRISKADGWGVWESAVWEMQITRKRDGELEDERRGGGEGVNGGGVSLCVCVCVCVSACQRESRERTKAEAERIQTSWLCMWCSLSQPLHSEAREPRRRRSSFRPQRGRAHQLCHANFTLNRLPSQVGGGRAARLLINAAVRRTICSHEAARVSTVVTHLYPQSEAGDHAGNKREMHFEEHFALHWK